MTDLAKLQQAIDLNAATYHAGQTLNEAWADVERVAKLMEDTTPKTFNQAHSMIIQAAARGRKLLKEAIEES